MRAAFLLPLLLLPLAAQTSKVLAPEDLFRRNVGTREQQYAQFPPHKIIGNIYYVGTRTLTSFLIATPQGAILLNTTYERNVPVIQKSVEQLGFNFSDIRIVLGSANNNGSESPPTLIRTVCYRNPAPRTSCELPSSARWAGGR